MHPYIAQIDEVAQGSTRGVVRWLWDVHPVKSCATIGGFVLGCALSSFEGGVGNIGQLLMEIACLGLVFPTAYFLAKLPIFLTLHFDQNQHNEICRNTLHHTAVAWCAVDPKMIEVFSHFKNTFEQASPKTRAQLISLMLGWDQPQSLLDLRIGHAEAKRRFDEMFPSTVAVEENKSGWRSFSKKYLRI